MDTGRDRLTGRLHVAVALLAAWLIFTSPWIAMYRRLPAHASWLDLSHVGFGFVAFAFATLYLYACVRAGRWRAYFPWLAGHVTPAIRELGGLLRGRIPSAEGGGLFAVIEGLALLAMFITAATGVGWFVLQGASEALTWREAHVVAARILVGTAALHVVTVSLHLLELIRD
jgi:hypothetical protein